MPGGRPSRVPIIPALDGLRAGAILLVVVLHTLLASGAPTGEGAFGVAVWGVAGNVIDVFFILSGFLLFMPFVIAGGRPSTLREYAVARGVRLLPAYWLALALSLVGLAVIDGYATPGVGSLVANATAMQMPARLLDSNLAPGFGINGPLWMISLIIGFYVVLPLVAKPYLRHPLIGLALAAALTVGWKLAAVDLREAFAALEGNANPPWVIELVAVDQLPGWAFSFALGMTGAWAYVRWAAHADRRTLEGPAMLLLAGAGAACAVCAYLYGREAAAINAPFAGSYARRDIPLTISYSTARALVIAAIVLAPAWVQRPFASRPARRVAQLSYGLYLIHLPIVVVMGGALLGLSTDGSPLAVGAWITLVLALGLLYAAVTRRYFERPLVRWAQRTPAKRAPIESRAPDAREEPSHPRGEAQLPARAARPGGALRL